MINANVKVAVFWGPRRATVEECARLVVTNLGSLEEIAPGRLTWQKYDPLRTTVNTHSLESIQRLLERGQNRLDVGKEVIPDLGFHLELRSGTAATLAEYRVNCGLYSNVGGLRNNCILNLSRELALELGEGFFLNALKGMIETWSPDGGGAYVLASVDDEVEKYEFLTFAAGRSRVQFLPSFQPVIAVGRGSILRDESLVRRILGSS